MRIVAVLLALLLPFAASSQITFERTYGESDWDFCYSAAQTDDGGFILAGETASFGAGSYDVYLIRTDAWGDTLWTRTHGGWDYDYAWSVERTEDGGCILAGGTSSFGAGEYDVYLVKTDASGDTVWTRTYGGSSHDSGWVVKPTSDGGYIVVGETASFGAGNRDIYLIKTDASGDTLWTHTYGGAGFEYGFSVAERNYGGYVVGGYTSSFGVEGWDVYLIETDASGDTVWARTYGGVEEDYGRSVVEADDGGYVVAGRTSSFGAGSNDLYLIKTDASGDTVWTRTYGGSAADGGSSIDRTADGGYVVAGRTESFGAGDSDVYLMEIDSLGDSIWTRTYGGAAFDRAYCVRQTADGGYIIAAETRSFGVGNADFYVIKTDGDGLVGVNHPPDLIDQPDTTVAELEYLTFTLEATDPELDSIWFSSPDLPSGAMLDAVSGLFEWTPGDGQAGLHTVTFIATDVGSPALADTEQTDITVTEAVGVVGDEDGLGRHAQYLAQNHPNPFGSATTILYSLAARQLVNVAVYDIRGARVRQLVHETVAAGVHRVTWDGRDGRGRNVGSGVYFCWFQAGDFSETRRIVLLR